MAKTIRYIEKKYSKKIDKITEYYKDKPQKDWWVALDILKNQMRDEMLECGLIDKDGKVLKKRKAKA